MNKKKIIAYEDDKSYYIMILQSKKTAFKLHLKLRKSETNLTRYQEEISRLLSLGYEIMHVWLV